MSAVRGTVLTRGGVETSGAVIFTDEDGRDHVFTPHAILAVAPKSNKIVSVYLIGGQKLDIMTRNSAQAIAEYARLTGADL